MEGRLSNIGDISPELSSNEAASQLEPNMQYFGKKCHIRNTLGGYDVYGVDFKYLNEAIRHLEENHEVVRMEFQRKNELSELVMKYFIYCASLEECLKKTRKIRLAINISLGESEQEEKVTCLRRMEELENFKEYFHTHLMVIQRELSKKLQTLNKKVSKRLKSAKRWRKALNITSVVVSVIVPFMGVITAMVAPPVATALVQANTILLGFIDKWFDSFWKEKEKSLKEKDKVIRSMELKEAGDQDLNTILDSIYKVGVAFESHFQNADVGEEDTMKNLVEFLKKIEGLCKQADMYNLSIGNARKGVLMSIIDDSPNRKGTDWSVFSHLAEVKSEDTVKVARSVIGLSVSAILSVRLGAIGNKIRESYINCLVCDDHVS